METKIRVMHMNGRLQNIHSTGRQVDVKCVGKQAARKLSDINISYKKQERTIKDPMVCRSTTDTG